MGGSDYIPELAQYAQISQFIFERSIHIVPLVTIPKPILSLWERDMLYATAEETRLRAFENLVLLTKVKKQKVSSHLANVIELEAMGYSAGKYRMVAEFRREQERLDSEGESAILGNRHKMVPWVDQDEFLKKSQAALDLEPMHQLLGRVQATEEFGISQWVQGSAQTHFGNWYNVIGVCKYGAFVHQQYCYGS